MEDREIVAAIAAGDPDGTAAAYDTYARSVYGYCRWMLREPAEAAEAVQDTFVLATAEAGALTDPGFLRSWLFATARGECLRRPSLVRGGSIGVAGDAAEVEGADRAAGADRVVGAGGAAGAGRDKREAERAELQALIPATLAEFEPEEREAVVLSLWHDLDDADLAAVFGVSRPEAYAMASGGRTQLEKALSTLRIARSGRAECPELGALLADWDGRLTIDTLHLADRHTEQCQTCAAGRRGKLRPEVLARLLPLPALPAGLRQQVLELCAGNAPAALAYREQVRERAGALSPAWVLPEAGRAAGPRGARPGGARPGGAGNARARWGRLTGAAALAGWSKTRSHPRVAAVVVIAVAAAVSVPVMAAGSAHVPRTLIPRAGTGTFSSAGTPVPTGGGASAGTGTGRSPSPSPQPTAAARLTPSMWSPPQPSPTKSARPSKSASPKPSPSSSAPSPSPSSPSPTPTHTRPASPPPTPTPTDTTTTTPSPTATSS